MSPEDSKFCNECGAALHLAPCPHCGAVNDLSLMDACARCHGDLLPPPEPAVAETLEEAFTALVPLQPLPPLLPPGAKARPWPLLLGGVLLMAGASVAGYVVYQQRSAPSEKSIAIIDAVVRDALQARPAAAPASAAERPAAARPIEVTATAFEPEPPPPPVLKPSGKPVIPRPPPAAAPTAARNAVTPPPPKIGPCTDAVAALGLCGGDAESNTRRP